LIGKTLAHYEITALLGRGGMGEVYRARDAKLGREVALKLLPESFTADPERLARFRREARVLASLQHPNIAGIFGIEDDAGRVFLTMELAEGTDLSERIARGPIAEDEVVDLARQLASGLEEAHEKGIVHRDLKPANVKIGEDGKVKILDFGLARALTGETSAEEDIENSPTITAAMTQGGMILGTAAYMSPEQARGRSVDRRADIWSFGVVLFEMLTGRRLFEGDTVSDTLASVLKDDVAWDQLPEETSPGMRRLLERCLERDPRRRLRDIGEARVFLEAAAADASLLGSVASVVGSLPDDPDLGTTQRRRGALVTVALALAAAVAGTLVGWQLVARPEAPPVYNMAMPVPPGAVYNFSTARPGPPRISPDGSMVVFAVREGSSQTVLHLRRLADPHSTPLTGTEEGLYPFWSADSRTIGFGTVDGRLRRVPVAGGPPVTLCDAANMKGATTNADGVVLFAPAAGTGIQRVSSAGGTPVEITTVDQDAGHDSHRHPRFLPDGEHFLYLARRTGGQIDEHDIYLASIDGGEPRLVLRSQTQAEFSRGHLLSVREGTLLATPFDPSSEELGEPIPLVEDVLVDTGAALGVFSANDDGGLVYMVRTGGADRFLEWVGLGDEPLGRVGDPGGLERPRVSPDGRQAVVEVYGDDPGEGDLWLVDLENGLRTRFTFEPGYEGAAEWTPDGTRVVYTAFADSVARIVVRPVEGTGDPSVLYEFEGDVAPTGVTPDGNTVLINQRNPETDYDVHSLPMDGGTPTLLVETPLVDYSAAVSPDGRWMVYGSGQGSEWDVYVRPVSGGERRWQINREPALYPFWGARGERIYYVLTNGELRFVEVDGSSSTFRTGAPQRFAAVSPPGAGGVYVSMHPDGERLLTVSGSVAANESSDLQLVTDWTRGLTK
jgi:serine/threonine protein kinase/Tol biopolymer transport system component